MDYIMNSNKKINAYNIVKITVLVYCIKSIPWVKGKIQTSLHGHQGITTKKKKYVEMVYKMEGLRLLSLSLHT